jgi:hypothetical protein
MVKRKNTKEQILKIASEGYAVKRIFNEVEFKKDVYNLFIIRKMIARFLKSSTINEKLLLNNIIIAINTFGPEKVNQMLRIILSDEEFSVAKSMLLFLKCYCLWDDDVESNRIIDDILIDTAIRYNLEYKSVRP